MNKTINFGCNLDVKTESEPWQKLADKTGIPRTDYFRLMLKHELKHETIYKKLKI